MAFISLLICRCEVSARFLNQSKSEDEQRQCNPELLLALNCKLLYTGDDYESKYNNFRLL